MQQFENILYMEEIIKVEPIQAPVQPTPMPSADANSLKSFAVGSAFWKTFAASGKAMSLAAIVQCVMVAVLYVIGYLLTYFSLPISDLMYEHGIEVEELTLGSVATLMIWTALLLAPPVAFMFCYSLAAKKAVDGNDKALMRTARYLKTFFLVSAIIVMVALFFSVIIAAVGLVSSATNVAL